MGRKKKPFFEKVEITDIGAEGKAIARVDEKVVFVKMVAPGDIVDLQVFKKRKKYMEAKVVAFHKYSELRATPFCEHFGVCGGCKWQHLPYAEQLKFKQKQVVDALSRIGGIELPEVMPILGSKQDKYYRNKMEFSASSQRWLTQEEIDSDKEFYASPALGFHVPGLFDKIVNIDKCWLQADPSNKIRNTIRDFAIDQNLGFFEPKEQSGFLRNLIIRTSTTGDLMVIVVFKRDDKEKRIALLSHLQKEVKEITSLNYVINEKLNDTLYDQQINVFSGKDHIIERMEDLEFKIGPKSFFQTNSYQSLELYRVARDFAGLSGNEVVYDLYTGTGSIAIFLARMAGKVIGIESVPEAIEDARINSKLNNIDNTRFFAGDMKDLFSDEFVEKQGRPDIIITDPPRAGMHTKVIEQILKLEAGRIVYVSCNPATQARDLKLLDEKYKVKKVQPVDMFPHTHHVENVVMLELKK